MGSLADLHKGEVLGPAYERHRFGEENAAVEGAKIRCTLPLAEKKITHSTYLSQKYFVQTEEKK